MSYTINNRGINAFHELEKPSDGRMSEERLEKHTEARQELWRTALNAAMAIKEQLARDLYHFRGVWWSELAPLTAAERTAILRELRHMWDLPPLPERKR